MRCRARALMREETGSRVGKAVLVTALACLVEGQLA